MSKENNGGPAFPERYNYETDQQMAEPGMTLRDYFAIRALPEVMRGDDISVQDAKGNARWSYVIADAMLKAREE